MRVGIRAGTPAGIPRTNSANPDNEQRNQNQKESEAGAQDVTRVAAMSTDMHEQPNRPQCRAGSDHQTAHQHQAISSAHG